MLFGIVVNINLNRPPKWKELYIITVFDNKSVYHYACYFFYAFILLQAGCRQQGGGRRRGERGRRTRGKSLGFSVTRDVLEYKSRIMHS